jgi:hypothetical protein
VEVVDMVAEEEVHGEAGAMEAEEVEIDLRRIDLLPRPSN